MGGWGRRAQGRPHRNWRHGVRDDDYPSCPKFILLILSWQDESGWELRVTMGEGRGR